MQEKEGSSRRRRQEQQNGFLGGASLWTLEGWMGKCRRRKAAADDLTEQRPKLGTLAAPLRLDRCLRGPLCGSSTRLLYIPLSSPEMVFHRPAETGWWLWVWNDLWWCHVMIVGIKRLPLGSLQECYN